MVRSASDAWAINLVNKTVWIVHKSEDGMLNYMGDRTEIFDCTILMIAVHLVQDQSEPDRPMADCNLLATSIDDH